MSQIHEKIIAIMAESDAIAKGRRNQQQGFNFRGIDDVYNSLHPLLAKHGVFSTTEVIEERTEERTTKSGGALIYRMLKVKFHFYAADGSTVESVIVGEGMDSGDKASNKAMSAAYKYAAFQAFCIPTEGDNDADASTPDVVSKTTDAHPSAPGNPFDADPAAFKDERDEILSLVSASNRVEDLTELWHTPRVRKFIKEAPADISDVVKTAFTSRKAGLLAKAA